jgi:hypothetical protein
VEPEYRGTGGKMDNRQEGVFVGYASRHSYVLLDKKLYVPEKCFAPITRKKGRR